MKQTDCYVQDDSPNLDKCMKRSNKPLMERRRRERINSSLNQLKYLVLEALKKDTSQYSKLEKADILEMAVQHLQNTHNANTKAKQVESTVTQKYTDGFKKCATEVTNYLNNVSGLNPESQSKLICHLSQCARKITSSELPREQMNAYCQSADNIHALQEQSNISSSSHYVNIVSSDIITQNCISNRLNASHCANSSPQVSMVNGSIYVIPPKDSQLSSFINILPQSNISVDVPCSKSVTVPIMMSPKLDFLLTPPPSPTDERLYSKHIKNLNHIISPNVPSRIVSSGCTDSQLWRPW